MLYEKWLEEWMELYVRPSTRERTCAKYRRIAEKYLLPRFGGLEMDQLTAVALQKFSAELTSRGLAANTANGILAVLSSSLRKAVALGLADKQFSDCIVRPKTREKKIACFGQDEQKTIERYILDKRKKNLFGIVIALYTGLRIGELLALTWDDVDFANGRIAVSRSCHDSWKNGRYIKVFDAPKTPSSERTIPVPRRLLERMRDMKRRTASPFVVIGRTEQGAQVRSYQKTFETLLRKLGIPHRGFHALRHTFATRALEVGMDVRTLSEILGHKNPVITLQRYAHSLMEHKAAMMDKVGRLLQ